MIGLTYEQIIEKIKAEKGLSEEEINAKIKKKLEQLSDLISKEGAAHIIANELGVNLFEKVSKRFKVKDLSPMLRNIEVAAKIIRLYEIRSFKTEKREGRLAAMLVGDDTANIRVVIWDEPLIKMFEEGQLKEGDTVLIMNAYVRDNNGFKELHLGSGSGIEANPKGVEINVLEKGVGPSFERKRISELNEGDFASICGTVVQLFEPRFYEACPECGKKLEQQGGKLVCREHNAVSEAAVVPIVNFFMDDGTDNIRVVCFRDHAGRVLNVTKEQLLEIRANPDRFQEVRDSVIGSQLIINGRVRKNEMFNRLEFSASSVEEADPEKLIKETAAK